MPILSSFVYVNILTYKFVTEGIDCANKVLFQSWKYAMTYVNIILTIVRVTTMTMTITNM